MKAALLIALTVLSILPAAAMAQSRPFVITKEGNKVVGSSLSADRQGNLSLTLADKRITRSFRKGSYRAAYVPRPPEVRKLQAAYSQGEFDYVDKNADDLLQEYGYLGWGDMILYIRAKIALDRKNPQQALEYLKRGQQYPGIHGSLTKRALAETYVALEDYSRAEELINSALENAEKATMLAALFNLKGKLRTAQNRKQEAVLEYMKTVLLLDKKKIGENTYEEARLEMVELMKGMNDRRYEEFENL